MLSSKAFVSIWAANEISLRQVFLGHYLGMIFHIGCGIYPRRELGDTYGASHLIERAVLAELLGHGHKVDRLLVESQSAYGLEYLLVGDIIETVGHQHVADVHVGVLLKHTRAEHHLLEVCVAWRQLSGGVGDLARYVVFSLILLCLFHI